MEKKTLGRRDFLSMSASLGAAGVLGTSMLTSCGKKSKNTPLREEGTYYVPELNDKAIDGRELKVGLVGCGGRGSGALGNLLDAADNIKVVAFGDTFEDRIDGLCAKFKKERDLDLSGVTRFIGLDAYKQVIDSGIDMVILTTPPVFRPEHFQYATEKGVHSFLEKPIAIDSKGVRSVIATAKQAEAKGLCVITGTQRHHKRDYVEANKLIQQGAIGEITGGNVYWNQGQLWYKDRQPGWTDREWQIRNWVNWTWLSGDHIVEQHVHNIDVFMWMSGLKPASAVGFGNRNRRVTGDQYDQFSIDFTMENGIHMHSMCRQINGCTGNVSEFIQGTKGSWSSDRDGSMNIMDLQGNVIWSFDKEAEKANFQQTNPYVLEHVDWVNHIRKGETHVEAEETAYSCLAGVMGRESAYTGKLITWNDILSADMDLLPEGLDLGKCDLTAIIPVPGSDKK